MDQKFCKNPKFCVSKQQQKINVLIKSRPAWAGMMQAVHQGEHPGKSSVHLMPMIDMNPADSTCIISTLKFVCEQGSKYNITLVITFDQPLWWKARTDIMSELETSELCRIVLRLGGLS